MNLRKKSRLSRKITEGVLFFLLFSLGFAFFAFSGEDFSLHLNLGVAYYNEAQYEKAKEEFKKALEINPDSFEAHYNLLLIYLATGDFTSAEAEAKACLKLNGAYPELHFQLGNMGIFIFIKSFIQKQRQNTEKNLKKTLIIFPLFTIFPKFYNYREDLKRLKCFWRK